MTDMIADFLRRYPKVNAVAHAADRTVKGLLPSVRVFLDHLAVAFPKIVLL